MIRQERQRPPSLQAPPVMPLPVVAKERTGADRAVELIISWLLRIGVWSSIAIVVTGLVMLFVTDRSALFHPRPGGLPALVASELANQPLHIDTYRAVLTAVAHGEAYGVIMLGLLVLLFTPVMRVAVSIAAFLIERDYLYTAITVTVLGLLVLGMVLGRASG